MLSLKTIGKGKHFTVEELEALPYELAALPLALFAANGLMRDSAKAKRARDLCKKWGETLDSIEPSLIVFDGGMLLNHLNSRVKLPHLLSR